MGPYYLQIQSQVPPLGVTATVVIGSSDLTPTDQAAFDDLAGRLVATGAWLPEQVIQGIPPTQIRSGDRPLAILWRGRVTEVAISCNPIEYRREVRYTLTIEVKDEDEDDRTAELDRLSAIAQDAGTGGPSLGGFCHPAETQLSVDQQYQATTSHPSQRVTLTGSFVYITQQQGRSPGA